MNESREIVKGVSVVICCYNSAKRLPETLAALAKQQVNPGISWEVLIIDNNSSDNTGALAEAEWLQLRTGTPLRVVFEPQPGLSHAREAGLKAATYTYIIYCDDDNWLFPEYVQVAYEVMEAQPQVGILGGCGIPKLEKENSWFPKNFLLHFATGPQATQSGDITESRGAVYGAASVYRKDALERLYEMGFEHICSDRKGKQLLSGGDTELSYGLRVMGYRLWYDDRLQFFHFIPASRNNLRYIKSLFSGFGLSDTYIAPYEFYNAKKGQVKDADYDSVKSFLIKRKRQFKFSTMSSIRSSIFRLRWIKAFYHWQTSVSYIKGLESNIDNREELAEKYKKAFNFLQKISTDKKQTPINRQSVVKK